MIPFFIGLGVIFASLLAGRTRRKQITTDSLEGRTTYQSLPASDSERFARAPFSVTEQTTRQLEDSDLKR